jgi:hypothetical protein
MTRQPRSRRQYLQAFVRRRRVRRLDLAPHWPESKGGDVSDWLDEAGGGHTPSG